MMGPKWDFRKTAGSPLPLGVTHTGDGVNFSVFSSHATAVALVLFEKEGSEPFASLPFDASENKTGHIWHVHLAGIPTDFCYAYRAEGPFEPEPEGHRFQGDQVAFAYACQLFFIQPLSTGRNPRSRPAITF